MLTPHDLLRSLPDQAVAGTDLAGLISLWTPAAVSLTGWSATDVIGRPLDWLHAHDGTTATTDLGALQAAAVRGHGWWTRKDGGRLWCEFTRFAVRDLGGEVTGYAEAFRGAQPSDLSGGSDGTGGPPLGAKLGSGGPPLAAAERVAQMGSWEYDIAADHVSWSDGAYDLFGAIPGGMPEHLVWSPAYIHPDDRLERDAVIKHALETGTSFEQHLRIIRTDGRIRVVHARGEVRVDREGSPQTMVGTLLDVTDLHDATWSLQECAAELSRRAQQIEQMLRVVVAPGTDDAVQHLSERQQEILRLAGDGLSNVEIADRLFLTENTVKWHMAKILRILGVANRTQAVAKLLGA